MLQSMGLPRVGHHLAAEQQQGCLRLYHLPRHLLQYKDHVQGPCCIPLWLFRSQKTDHALSMVLGLSSTEFMVSY